jgi:hypothetical protein
VKGPSPVTRLLHGDNLALMRELAADKEVAGRVNLVYTDPPFNTGGTFYVGGSSGGRGVTDVIAYRDNLELDVYTAFMRERLDALTPLLAPRASVFLHADARAIHYLKVLMDGVYGHGAFVNEIIWHYRSGGTARKRYSAKHDTILWYAPNGEPVFNRQAVSTRERADRNNHMKRTVNEEGQAVRTIRGRWRRTTRRCVGRYQPPESARPGAYRLCHAEAAGAAGTDHCRVVKPGRSSAGPVLR